MNRLLHPFDHSYPIYTKPASQATPQKVFHMFFKVLSLTKQDKQWGKKVSMHHFSGFERQIFHQEKSPKNKRAHIIN